MKTVEAMKEIFNAAAEEINDARSMDDFEMYRTLIQRGEQLALLAVEERTAANYVEGCISNVFVTADLIDGRVYFRASSDAQVIRGYLAIMVEALSGLPPKDIVDEARPAVEKFAFDVNIKGSLTPTRANAFASIFILMLRKAQMFIAQ